MKKLTLFLWILAIPIISFSQQIPNSSFENWLPPTQIYQSLTDWRTSNSFSFGLTFSGNVSPTTDAKSGDTAAKLVTVTDGNEVLPGAIYLAQVNPNKISAPRKGIPFTSRPDSLVFYYKTSMQNSDEATILLFMKKQGTYIGNGVFKLGGTNSTYKRFAGKISYFTSVNPDSLMLIISSSDPFGSPQTGSTLIIDSLHFPGLSFSSLPNANMEKWEPRVYSDLYSWRSSNLLQLVSDGGLSVFRDTSSTDGNFSVMLESKFASIKEDTLAFVTIGDVDIDTREFSGGLPVNNLPKMLTGDYKYEPVGNDSAQIRAWLLKGNGKNPGHDTLKSYIFKLGPQSTWTKFSFDLDTTLPQMPDSANIVFLSSDYKNSNVRIGSKLWLDNILIEYSITGIRESGKAGFRFYPNPVEKNNVLNIEMNASSELPTDIRVISPSGQIILTKNLPRGIKNTGLNIAVTESGIYFLQVRTADKTVTKILTVY